MNREFLKELGFDDETIEKVMAEHGKTVNDIKGTLKDTKAELDNLKEQLSARDEQLEELKQKAKGNEELESMLESQKEANQQMQKAYEKKLYTQKLNYEVENALSEAGAYNPKTARALLDLETVKLDEDGNLKGLKEQLEEMKKTDWYLFADESDEGEEETPTHTPGPSKKMNSPKDVDPVEAGKQKAMERFGLNKEDNKE